MRILGSLSLVALVLASCAAAPATSVAPSSAPASGSPSVTATEAPSVAPSAFPAPSESSPNRVLADIAVLEATVNGLLLRSGPSVDADPFVFPCNPVGGCTERVVVDAGWTMVALDGPVMADGYEWHLVQLTPEYPGSAHLGWVASPTTGDAWLIPSSINCPAAPPDLNQAIEIGAVQLLYCYGHEELTLEGFVVNGFGCNVQGTFEPEWLAHPCANMSFISPARSDGGDRRLFLHYPAPGVLNPTLDMGADEPVRIEGHFDDAAAADCRMEADDEASYPAANGIAATDPQADIAQCRLRFVVTRVENLIVE